MNWPDAYSEQVVNNWIERLDKLHLDSQPQWGKMNAGQLLAHLNVTYDMASGNYPSNNRVTRWLLNMFVKPSVVGPKPYPKNSRTAPQFLVSDEQDFEKEKKKFIENIKSVQMKGATHYEGLASPSFGTLTAEEWSVTFSKHIEHHFDQFSL